LVTGAAGFIGSHLCHRLVAEGQEVVGLDDLSAGRIENLAPAPEVRFEQIDLRDQVALRAAAVGCSTVFHQAAMTSVKRSVEQPAAYADVNVRGTVNVLMAAREAGATVVFASSSSIYGDQPRYPLTEDMEPRPRSPYAASKLAGEGFLRSWWHSYGIPTLCLRYCNVYGPRQDPGSPYAAVIPRFISACLSGERPVIYGDGEQSRDFTFVDDVVEANLLAARAPQPARGQVMNVAAGAVPTTVNGLLAAVAELTDTRPDPQHEPPREGDIRRSEADISKARRLLGYEPRIGIAEGLRRTIDWFRTR
jgi:UDP-glucose 4-epimerase